MKHGIPFGIAFLILVGATQSHAQNVPVPSPNLGNTNLHQVVQTAQKPAIIAQEPQAHETSWRKFMTDPNATFAGAVALFTAALVWVGWKQLKALNKTVEATKFAAESTYAIEKPIIISKDAVMVVSPSDRSETFNLEIGPFIQIHMKNTGRTPAILQSLAVKTMVLSELPDLPDLAPPSPFHPGKVLENGESQYIFKKCSYYTSDMNANILSNRMFWWAYGYIVYTDFANREHRTGFCYRWSPPGVEHANGKWLDVNFPNYVYLT